MSDKCILTQQWSVICDQHWKAGDDEKNTHNVDDILNDKVLEKEVWK